MAYAANQNAVAPAIGRSLSTIYNELVARFQRNRKFRQTFNELNTLSDAELADLGLNRSMIRRVALEATSEH
ncbi:DUF1127 domain-containing protein [Shimia sp.]|uniref:DUF1127 domain-containing protein n=1 Tax=Shimia sp. TaxID=1954381 RepID=UPI00329759DF